jgi:multiple sugar transport system substrate-binding protein
MSRKIFAVTAMGLLSVTFPLVGSAQNFNWRQYSGKTIHFLANNNTVGDAIKKYISQFEQKTGITVDVDTFQEQQMRQHLITKMRAHSNDIDVFMTLPSRYGAQFTASGWYTNLKPMVKSAPSSYDFRGFSPALIKGATFNGKLSSVPANIEGPVVYYRKDIFKKCGVTFPNKLSDLINVARKIAKCDKNIVPFVSRGLKPALPYTFSVFRKNMGGQLMKNGKSMLNSDADRKAINYYVKLLKNYGPEGVVNYTFYQATATYRTGKSAMSFQSSNDFANIMKEGARLHDTGIRLLPPGPAGSHPTVIGWGLAISKYSQKKDAAWLFLQWATSKKMQEKMALDGVAPPRSSVANSGEFKKWLAKYPVRREWINTINKAAKTGTSEIGYPIIANSQSRFYIGGAVDAVLLGQKSVKQATSEADQKLDRLIQRSQR